MNDQIIGDPSSISAKHGKGALRAELDAKVASGRRNEEAYVDTTQIAAMAGEPIQSDQSSTDDLKLNWHGDDDDSPLKERLVDKTLPKVGKALIAGQWGTYKTFVALDLSASVMTKTPFAGRRVDRQGGVLFIAAEGQDEVRVRLAALAMDKVAPVGDQAELVRVDPAKMPFVWIESCPRLTADDALAQLRRILAAAAGGMESRHGLPLALIIIDTLMPAAGFKDANDSSETQRVMSVLTSLALEFQVLVLVVDHFGKDPKTGTRNSSVKEDAVDAVLALLADRDLAGNVTNSRLAIRKVRGATTGQELPFQTRSVVVREKLGFDAVTSLVVDWDKRSGADSGVAKSKRWPRALFIFKNALDTALGSYGRTMRPFAERPEVTAVDREKVREEFLRIYPADNVKAKGQAFRRCERDAVVYSVMVAREVGPPEKLATVFWPLSAHG
jgi:AAA domain